MDEAEQRAQFNEHNTDIACFMEMLKGAAQGDKIVEFVGNQVCTFSMKKPHYNYHSPDVHSAFLSRM